MFWNEPLFWEKNMSQDRPTDITLKRAEDLYSVVQCPICEGENTHPNPLELTKLCWRCGGRGEIIEFPPCKISECPTCAGENTNPNPLEPTKPCPRCGGQGEFYLPITHDNATDGLSIG